MTHQKYEYIERIDSPQDLKRLRPEELPAVCKELRCFLVEQLANNPGHIGSSLGTVELATAIHYVYDSPRDKIIWDVGHQAYAHKILTGRRDLFHTNRCLNGLSGFPRRSESEHDAFGGGHSSVSISAAYGIAKANELLGIRSKVVAVIGDGAMSGGLAFEGLNNAGASDTDLLVILNDNHMSISPNVGALKEYLLNISTSKHYNNFKNKVWKGLEKMPRLRRMIQKTGNALKLSFLQHSNLFESFNFRYFGPVDGNDIKAMVRVLNDLKEIPGPKLLHVLTVKGKGYAPAEQNQSVWHAPGKFDPDTGELIHSTADLPLKYQEVFGNTLLELARMDKRVVGITPAMPLGCSLDIMMREMPERCFDVGIAEGHAVTFSAGLATQGLVPFCNIYSSFMQRAYDNAIHDVAIQGLPVVICLDRAGLVGEDGATHHGALDLAYFRCVPNLIIAAPMNETELRNMMYTALYAGKPFVIRYPRGRGVGSNTSGPFETLVPGRGRLLRDGKDLAVITIGTAGNAAAKAIERAEVAGVSIAHVDLRYAKPLDEELLHRIGKKFRRIVTVEDGAVMGGVGSAVLEFFSDHGYDCRVERLGIGDRFVEHGTQAQLYKQCGYDEEGIYGVLVADRIGETDSDTINKPKEENPVTTPVSVKAKFEKSSGSGMSGSEISHTDPAVEK